MKLARHYQALLDSKNFESRAALARHLGVSRARVTQVLNRLKTEDAVRESISKSTAGESAIT
jgi:biotin operon repressor